MLIRPGVAGAVPRSRHTGALNKGPERGARRLSPGLRVVGAHWATHAPSLASASVALGDIAANRRRVRPHRPTGFKHDLAGGAVALAVDTMRRAAESASRCLTRHLAIVPQARAPIARIERPSPGELGANEPRRMAAGSANAIQNGARQGGSSPKRKRQKSTELEVRLLRRLKVRC